MNDRRANWITGEIANSRMYGYGTTQLVLTALRSQLGPDAIRTLWRSDSSFAVSLSTLTGQPIATTVRTTLDVAFSKAPAEVRQFRALGPLPRMGSLLLMAGIVIMLFVAAGVAVRRNGFTS